jgi:hypothetical protein
MFRSGFARFAVTLALVAAALAPRYARAQTGPGGPQMPLALDVTKVAVGSWAEYTMVMGKMPPMKMRMGLVARGPAGHTFENTVEGGMLPAGTRAILQAVLPPGGEKDGKPSKLVMQMGNADPMEMPQAAGAARPFIKPDPKTLVGSETVKVPAGTFKTKHYRDKSAEGDPYDFWVSDKVAPLGLVKLEGKVSKNPVMAGVLRLELVATGTDAKPLITKPAKPFDPAMLGGRAGGPPPPAPAKK